MNRKKTICVITGGRADYDLLKPIIKKMQISKIFNVRVAATGSHFIKGQNTFKQIEKDKIKINYKIKIKYKKDSNKDILQFFSDGINCFKNLFENENFDAILVLGDRYEIFSAVLSAGFYRIPIIHLSGGEVTEGAIDESIRHSITKFSSFHFVSNIKYKNRIKQLGENPKFIFNVGSTGAENIVQNNLYSKKEIEKKLNLKFKNENYLVTFHPVTLKQDYGISDFKILLKYLSKKKNSLIIFTLPNSDANNYKITKLIKKFIQDHKHSKCYSSLGQKKYFSTIKNINAVIGNSSSGLSEVPSFKKPTINIGARQDGRIFAKSIVDVKKVNIKNLQNAFNKIKSKKFKKMLIKVKNPYSQLNTADKILNILKKHNFKKTSFKKFFDLKNI